MNWHKVDWNGLVLDVLEDEDGILDIGGVSILDSIAFIEYLSSEKSTCLEEIQEAVLEMKKKPALPPVEEEDLPAFEPMGKGLKPNGINK